MELTEYVSKYEMLCEEMRDLVKKFLELDTEACTCGDAHDSDKQAVMHFVIGVDLASIADDGVIVNHIQTYASPQAMHAKIGLTDTTLRQLKDAQENGY